MTDAQATEIISVVKRKIIGMDKIIVKAVTALRSGNNIVFYGDGGYAKTFLASTIYKATLYIMGDIKENYDEYVWEQSFGSGTDIDAIMGPLDVSAYLKNGEIKYLSHLSFAMAPFALMDEMFDAPPEVLEQLKFTISEKKICYTGGCIKSVNQHIIAATNRSPKEFAAQNSSYAALIEGRFPVLIEVKLEDTSINVYRQILGLKKPEQKPLTSETVETFALLGEHLATKGIPISPRLLGFMAKNFYDNSAELREASISVITDMAPSSAAGNKIRDFLLNMDVHKDLASLKEIHKLVKDAHKSIFAANHGYEALKTAVNITFHYQMIPNLAMSDDGVQLRLKIDKMYTELIIEALSKSQGLFGE